MSLHTTGAQYRYKEHQQPHTKVWLPSYWAIHNLLLLLTHSSLRTSAKASEKVGTSYRTRGCYFSVSLCLIKRSISAFSCLRRPAISSVMATERCLPPVQPTPMVK